MDVVGLFRPLFNVKYIKEVSKTYLIPHIYVNIILSVSYFLLKTVSPFCDILFTDCSLALQQWEWLTFLGCVIVLKNRKQASSAEYVSVACMFAKALNLIMFYQNMHFVFLPRPVYKGPEFVTYFRGPHLKNEIARDKRVTWVICFYAAWSPPCVTLAPVFSEISAEYHLENLQFGKIDISKFPEVAEEYRISTSSFSKQLPTVVVFQEGKEKTRRPAISAKGTVVKYSFTKQNIIKDFEINEIYNQCRKSLPKQKKTTSEAEKKEQ
ncbi:TMX2-like protein [Mya arenaria]|uniref:TMX2-like protein n=1 Tax=Mya arenaria TaxID=6604 RepID=A0ABY7E4R8_MYAAR|nr:TMX2-like protein [Mya arenaria]